MKINPTLIAYLTANARPLSLDLNTPFDDLRPLEYRLRDAQVVALGSSVRHSHELLTLTQRVMRYLIETHEFRALMLEGDEQAAAALDTFIRVGEGDAQDILKNARPFLRFQEILDAVRWLRVRNENYPDDQVRIVHFTEAHNETKDQLSDRERIEQRLADITTQWHEQTRQRIVYWGGLAHTAIGMASAKNAGSYLRERFDAGFVSIALTFSEGLVPFSVDEPGSSFVEAVLSSVDLETYLLDIQKRWQEPVQEWLNSPAKLSLIGPGIHEISSTSLVSWFDFVIHRQHVTSATAVFTPEE